MASFNVTCSGPGPHVPASGILGTSDRAQTADVRCASPSCVKPLDPTAVVQTTLQAAIDTRLAQLETFIANNPNGAVLTAAQTLIVAKMLAGLARVVRGALDSTGQAG